MPSQKTSKIFVVGGTGAQGIPVVQGLVKDKKYHVRVLTRDTTSRRAKALLALGNVELMEGSFSSEADLRAGYRGCDGAFINIDGFNTGEQVELFLAIRSYELAIEEGIKFFVYGNLDYAYKKSGYDPNMRAGHYDGKGRIGEWTLFQNQKNRDRMGAALFTSGPYIEMAIASQTIMSPKVEDGVAIWRVPLGDGTITHVSLDDCEYYVRWLFDNPERASGLDLEVGIADIPYADLAAAFAKVTGHPAKYIDVSLEEYWKNGPIAKVAHLPAGYNADKGGMNIKDNFTGFWNVWKYKVITRDYKFLDEIHPNRIKSAEEFFRREDQKARASGQGSLWNRIQKENLVPILKLAEDGRKGRL